MWTVAHHSMCQCKPCTCMCLLAGSPPLSLTFLVRRNWSDEGCMDRLLNYHWVVSIREFTLISILNIFSYIFLTHFLNVLLLCFLSSFLLFCIVLSVFSSNMYSLACLFLYLLYLLHCCYYIIINNIITTYYYYYHHHHQLFIIIIISWIYHELYPSKP